MPEINGKELFLKMRKINPGIRTILSSGYSINGEAQQILDDGVSGFLQKPYTSAAMSRIIENVTNKGKI